MSRVTKRLIREIKLNSLFYALIILAITSLLWIWGNDLSRASIITVQNIGKTIIEIAKMVMGAALTALVFSWISQKELVNTTLVVVENSLKNALYPIRQLTLENAIRNYRWDCWLGPLEGLTPEEDEKFKGYLFQAIRISYTVNEVPNQLKMIFAVGNKDGTLADFFDDERYIITYKIESKIIFDIEDPHVCSVSEVAIDNQPLVLRSREVKTVRYATKALEYTYDVPDWTRNQPVTIDFAFHVLKWVENDTRIYIPKQIFHVIEDSEFRLYVDRNVGVKSIIIDTTEVSKVTNIGKPVSGQIVSTPIGDVCARAILRFPVQAGSAIRFELQRLQGITSHNVGIQHGVQATTSAPRTSSNL